MLTIRATTRLLAGFLFSSDLVRAGVPMPACDLLFWWFGRGLDLDRSDWRRLDSRLPRLVAIMSDRQSVSFRRGINGRRFIRFASSRGQVECNLSGAGRSQRECSAQAQEAERKADGFQHLRCPQRDLTRRQGPFWREKAARSVFWRLVAFRYPRYMKIISIRQPWANCMCAA